MLRVCMAFILTKCNCFLLWKFGKVPNQHTSNSSSLWLFALYMELGTTHTWHQKYIFDGTHVIDNTWKCNSLSIMHNIIFKQCWLLVTGDSMIIIKWHHNISQLWNIQNPYSVFYCLVWHFVGDLCVHVVLIGLDHKFRAWVMWGWFNIYRELGQGLC